jgi:hypothetical protein
MRIKMKLTNEQKDLIKERISQGKNYVEIGNELKLYPSTIRYWANEENRKLISSQTYERFKKKSKEERKKIYERQKEYRKDYFKSRYNNDPIFREKVKERNRDNWRRKK